MSVKTEIIVEDDEMEDGSIFVCFMCEKEFNKVSLLNDHMQDHKNMPEMSKEFPSRRGGRGKAANRGAPKPRGRPRGRGNTNSSPATYRSPNSSFTAKSSPAMASYRTGVVSPVVSNPDVKTSAVKSSPVVSTPTRVPIKVEKDLPVTIKSDPDDPNTKSALRIRSFLQNRLLGSSKSIKKRPAAFDFDNNEQDMDDDGVGMPLAEEEIMMIPQPNIKTVTVPPSRKGTAAPQSKKVMMEEPVGFHAPTPPPKVASSTKRVRLRKKLIVQEVVYEEIEDDGEEGEDTIIEMRPLTRPVTKTTSGRGRGRPRSQPTPREVQVREPKFYDEEEEEEEEEEQNPREIIEVIDFPKFHPKMPGRRSQPRRVDEGPGVPCDICGKEFRSVTTLRVHARSHLEVKDIPCPYCDKVFPQRHVLHQHLVDDHEQSNNLTCSVCGKVFTRTDSLKSHMVRMHEEDGGLNCYICGKNFPSQGQLEMHVRVHTGERPFKCEYCNKGFVQKVHLRTHLRTMHDMHEIQNTPCRLCNVMLNGRAGLREHYNNEHGLTTNQYKTHVAKLRKEGKIPELPPPVVKEVDPSLNYYKVDVSNLTSGGSSANQTITKLTPRRGSVTKSRRGRPIRKPAKMMDSATSVETTTYCDADTTYEATELSFEDASDSNSKRRDQEELNIVESAFKVAEQMDQLGANVPGSTTILVAGEDSATTGVYYAIPVVMDNTSSTSSTATSSTLIQSTSTSNQVVTSDEGVGTSVTSTVTVNGTPISTTTTDSSSLQPVHFDHEEMDDEYAQFAAEHSHMGGGTFNTDNLGDKGSIVKAEPLQLFTDPNDSGETETVEMFTM